MSGNLSHSMRENYETHGVDEYYNIVASSYRNPHLPGIKRCLYSWFDRWWERERPAGRECERVTIWDLAAGSGEVTEAVLQWYTLRREKASTAPPSLGLSPIAPSSSPVRTRPVAVPDPRKRNSALSSLHVTRISLYSTVPDPVIVASDPYTGPAYVSRTSLPCASVSFSDVAEGATPPFPLVPDRLPNPSVEPVPDPTGDDDGRSRPVFDIVISSFALHLCSQSELFALLYELSTKARWLVVLAPHKKPEIKPGWGWTRWNLSTWKEVEDGNERDTEVEIVLERVRLRVWKSLNVPD